MRTLKAMSTAKTIRTTTRLVTTTTDLGTDFGMRYFSTGLREYNVTGWHVSPLHHGAYVKSTRAPVPCQQTKTPDESVGKPTLRCQEQKLDTPQFVTPQRVSTIPYESPDITPSLPKSINTFWPFAFPRVAVISLMPTQRRFHHEDGTGTPGVHCQPDCG